MYHYISNPPRGSRLPGLFIGPVVFETQLKTLKSAGYGTILPKDLGEYLTSGQALTEKNPIILSFDDGYEDFYTTAFPLLKKYNYKGILYVIYDFMDKPGYITREQAQEMVASGFVEIGSHTLDHVNLSQTSDAEALRQISESRKKLSEAIGTPVLDFAYPFGGFNYRDEGFVRQAGYLTAVSTYPGEMQSTNQIYSLYRIRPGQKINADLLKLIREPVISNR